MRTKYVSAGGTQGPETAELSVTAAILAAMGLFVAAVAVHQAPAALRLLLG